MKYPTLKDVANVNTQNTAELFKVIPKCIKSVYEGEKIIEDFTDEEISEFVKDGILSQVLKESGGENANFLVIPTASMIPKQVGKNYKKALKKLGLNATIENTQNVTLNGLKEVFPDSYNQ